MNFTEIDSVLQRWIDGGYLPGVSYAVLRGTDTVRLHCMGYADLEAGTPVREDTIFRLFSNTKLAVSLAALLLVEEGRFALDAPIAEVLPAFARMRVLRPGASTLDDSVPAHQPITLRHLLTHTAGLTYPFIDPAHILGKAYNETGAYGRSGSQTQVMERLAALPLLFEPGTQWTYSMATDVVGGMIEAATGQTLGAVLQARIFAPLGMVDTGFHVPAAKQARLAALYSGDLRDPLVPGLKRVDHALPSPGAYLSPPARESGGGGLVGTLPDYIRLLGTLLQGGPALLKPETLALLPINQLPPGVDGGVPPREGIGHGLACGLWVRPEAAGLPAAMEGELFWGGLAGTQWFVIPRANMAVALMTQRWMGSGNPYQEEFRRAVYAAL